MPKEIILFGTDLHGNKTEHAAKLVQMLKQGIKSSKIISIQNIKKIRNKEETIVIPRLFKNEKMRKIFQGILLPFYFMWQRRNSNKIFFFWTPNGKIYYFFLKFIDLLKYQTFFTIISGYEKDYSLLKFCNVIICQSRKMQNFILKKFPRKKVVIIWPGVDQNYFTPQNKKKIDLLIPSIPYKIQNFEERGVYDLIKILKEEKFTSTVIFRSSESYEYFKKLKLKKSKLVYKSLTDEELSKIMKLSRIVLILYKNNSPDMPLSAIEGICSGCKIICSDGMGLSDLVKKKRLGIVLKKISDLEKSIKKIKKEKPSFLVRKIFDKKTNIEKYRNILCSK